MVSQKNTLPSANVIRSEASSADVAGLAGWLDNGVVGSTIAISDRDHCVNLSTRLVALSKKLTQTAIAETLAPNTMKLGCFFARAKRPGDAGIGGFCERIFVLPWAFFMILCATDYCLGSKHRQPV